ncbi:RluA family pseudouridine synthase [bacterium]|nr:RluA family pseudouridine synthase [bacterium]
MIYIADENDEGKRLDLRVAEVLSDVSRSKVQSAIKDGKILVNNAVKKSSYTLKEDDVVNIGDIISEPVRIEPENIPLDIVYEDENMLVVNKPSGMLTHPTNQEVTGTLVNALLYKFGGNLSNLNGEFRQGIVHRLDRNTSGLLMIAKNNMTHEFIAEQIKNHKIEKKYRAILKGVWEKDEEIIDLPIGRNPKQPHKMAVIPDGKESQTIVKVIKRYKEATAVELTLITGRTHQIRVHTSYKGHPVYNDTLYGAGKGKVLTDEQVLQSFSLRFTKPFSDEIILLEIPADEKYNKVQKYLEGREK